MTSSLRLHRYVVPTYTLILYHLRTYVLAEATGGARCPRSEGWHENGGSCFYISAPGNVYDFENSVAVCESLGCTPVSILNQSENNFVAEIM